MHQRERGNQTDGIKKAHVIVLPVIKEPLFKRPLDIVLSTFMMIVSTPVSLLIALGIKLEDGGPIFYQQERWGRGGKRFKLYKFRTMVPNSDKLFGVKQASKNDSRISRVGKVLRAMGLDELPQVINIFKGDMSFVGPRALAVGEVLHRENGDKVEYEEVPGFWKRLSVRPGLTGITTIYKPKDISPQKKFRYDLLYVRNQSFWLDLRLIIISFWISFRGKWESRGKKV
jgi:lipopolysaccharide/colanic/teichoic acid biosynthesis glycosyltransferase